MSRARHPDGTLQARIFRLLRDVGSMNAAEITERLNGDAETCRRACYYLRDRRFIAGHKLLMNGKRGAPYTVLYYAVRRSEPEDLRGKRKGSHGNVKGRVAYAGWIRMMSIKHGRTWRPKVRGATALEEAWPIR